MPRMRGMLLFWLMRKVTSVSKKGCRSTRMPGAHPMQPASPLWAARIRSSRAG